LYFGSVLFFQAAWGGATPPNHPPGLLLLLLLAAAAAATADDGTMLHMNTRLPTGDYVTVNRRFPTE
jgi:hypothetical protein